MSDKTLDFYKFESIVNQQVGLYPIADEDMLFIQNTTVGSTAIEIYNVSFKYNGIEYKKLWIPPLGRDRYTSRCVIFDDNGFLDSDQVLVFGPWRYDIVTWTSSNIKKYLNTFEEIKLMQSAGFNVKQTGRWYKQLDNCTVVRTRFFGPYQSTADYRIQYTVDIVLYNNGLFEYRYPSFQTCTVKPGLSDFDNSNVMIFAYDRLKNPDAVISLSETDLRNQDIVLGGKRLTNTADISTQIADEAWPGKLNQGAIYRFVPPSDQIKKVLPRRLLRRQDNNSVISSPGMYDDRKTIPFVNQSITMPTRMPTLYGQLSTFGTSEYQINSNFYLTGTVDPSATEQWINYANGFQQSTPSPFSEINRLEENLKYTDFYKTGSRPEDVGFGFDNSLDHKVKISYELPVNNQYTLLASTASLIYYDKRSGGFALAGSGSLDGFYAYYNGFGDAKLYSPLGTPVAGGFDETVVDLNYKYSSRYYDNPLYFNSAEDASRLILNSNVNLSSSYQFSTASFSSYSGSNIYGIQPIIFSNDLSAPFLLEKAIIEIPFCAGPGWLNDTTKTPRMISKPYGGGFGDWKFTQEGGPCVTIGLIKENSEGKISDYVFYDKLNNPNYTYREVICSGTMIPVKDNISGYHYVFDNIVSPPPKYDITLVLTGFNVYSGTPSVVISSNNGNYFTGSAIFSLQPQVCNNFYYSYAEEINDTTNYNGYQFSNDVIDLANENKPGRFENYKAIGPGGLDQTKENRQLFGINNSPFNYVIKKVGDNIEKKLLVNNPLKSLEIQLSSSLTSIINSNPGKVNDIYAAFLGVNKNATNSPYLLYPGDKLTLFVSKYHSSEDNRNIIDLNNPSFGSSVSQPILQHDIKINTGTIKISLFGSYVKEGKSYSPPVSEPSTNNVSRIIGDYPVLDQLELYSDVELMGTYTDNIVLPVTQSLLNSPNYTTNVRGYKFIDGHSRMRVSSATFGKLEITEEDKNSPDLTLVRN